MRIYIDIFSNEELFTDSYPTELVDDIVYKVRADKITKSDKMDSALFGGNTDAGGYGGEKADDEQVDAVDENVQSGYNIVLNHGYQEFPMDLKNYKVTIRDYMKRIKEKLATDKPERVDDFMKKASKFFAEFIVPNFKNMTIFTGADYDTEVLMPIALEHEDGSADFFFWKDGCRDEKC